MFIILELFLVLALAGLPLAAAEGGAVAYWPIAKLKGNAAELAPKVNAGRYAIERLGGFGNHYVLVVNRLAGGPPESHEAQTDFYVVRAGEATSHVSGEIVGAKTNSRGEVIGLVRPRHRSEEFIEFLKLADAHYPPGARIRIVLDNRSAHISKETRAFLATLPSRFEFTFTSEHGSWLNLIESFSGTMARTLLCGIRVASAEELKARIELYLKEVNETPVVFRWKYRLETLPVA